VKQRTRQSQNRWNFTEVPSCSTIQTSQTDLFCMSTKLMKQWRRDNNWTCIPQWQKWRKRLVSPQQKYYRVRCSNVEETQRISVQFALSSYTDVHIKTNHKSKHKRTFLLRHVILYSARG